MSECHLCGKPLVGAGIGIDSCVCVRTVRDLLAQRDRYREALERILADDGPIGVPLHVRIIARKALGA